MTFGGPGPDLGRELRRDFWVWGPEGRGVTCDFWSEGRAVTCDLRGLGPEHSAVTCLAGKTGCDFWGLGSEGRAVTCDFWGDL